MLISNNKKNPKNGCLFLKKLRTFRPQTLVSYQNRLMSEVPLWRGTSLIRNTPLPGPYSRTSGSMVVQEGGAVSYARGTPVGGVESRFQEKKGHAIAESALDNAEHTAAAPPSYRGTSIIRNCAPLGPCSRPLPRDLWWS